MTESSPARNLEFDEYIDENHDVMQVFEAEFLASAILFQMEPNSYRIFLAEFLKESRDSEGME